MLNFGCGIRYVLESGSNSGCVGCNCVFNVVDDDLLFGMLLHFKVVQWLWFGKFSFEKGES